MELWNTFLTWLTSASGRDALATLVFPAASIIVAGLLAAWIASASIRRLLARNDRQLKVAAIAALIDAAEQASVWNSLTPQEQVLSDRSVGQADIQIRLLPVNGATIAANWAAHTLAQMRRNSATFGYQVEPAVVIFRDRLVEWQQRPGRSRREFATDIERWRTEANATEQQLSVQQDAWVASQHHEQFAAPLIPAFEALAPTAIVPTAFVPEPIRSAAIDSSPVQNQPVTSREPVAPPVNAFIPRRGTAE
jgi:hypothetical protein